MFLLLTTIDSFINSSRSQCNTRQHTHLYIYFRKAFGEYYDIQIARYYEIKLKIYFIFIFY